MKVNPKIKSKKQKAWFISNKRNNNNKRKKE